MENNTTESGTSPPEIAAKIKSLFSKEKYIKYIIAVGLFGIAIIFISGFFTSNNSSKQSSVQSMTITQDMSLYKQTTENDLTAIVSQIDGAGTAKVMVTVDSTAELVYATDDKTTTDSKSDGSSCDTQSSYFTVKQSDGTQQTVLLKEIQPKIRGVLVVCSGGGDKVIQSRVLEAVSKALNVSSAKVCITKLSD